MYTGKYSSIFLGCEISFTYKSVYIPTLEQNIRQVKKGMSDFKVRRILGYPDSRYKSGNYEVLTYDNDDYSNYHSYTLYFLNDVLDHFTEYESHN